LQVIETLMGWCDRQLQGYSNAIQNDREELEDPKTPWLRTQVRSLLCIHAGELRAFKSHAQPAAVAYAVRVLTHVHMLLRLDTGSAKRKACVYEQQAVRTVL
jgi:hypothetical protein